MTYNMTSRFPDLDLYLLAIQWTIYALTLSSLPPAWFSGPFGYGHACLVALRLVPDCFRVHEVLCQDPEKREIITFHSDDVDVCHQILEAKQITLPGKVVRNRHTKFEARAIPNERLKTAFNIHNCFVTVEAPVCAGFKKMAKGYVHMQDATWMKVRDQLRTDIRHVFSEDASRFALVPKIQYVALKATVFLFRDGVFHDLSFADELFYDLAKEINEQWLRSKDASKSEEWRWSKQSNLQDLIAAIGSDDKCAEKTAKTNVMNVILPGYETLWRVVLRCFIEVGFRGHGGGEGWQNSLGAFVDLSLIHISEPTRPY